MPNNKNVHVILKPNAITGQKKMLFYLLKI